MKDIREAFKENDYFAIVVGNVDKEIPGKYFDLLKQKMKELEDETGSKVIIREFNVRYGSII